MPIGIFINMLIGNFASSLEKPFVISTEVVEGAKRRDHAAEKSSASCSTSYPTTIRIGSTFQRYFITNPVIRRCFVRRKISPLYSPPPQFVNTPPVDMGITKR